MRFLNRLVIVITRTIITLSSPWVPSTLSMEQWNYVGTGEKQKVAKKKSDSAGGLKSFLERDKEEEYEVAEY